MVLLFHGGKPAGLPVISKRSPHDSPEGSLKAIGSTMVSLRKRGEPPTLIGPILIRAVLAALFLSILPSKKLLADGLS